MDAIATPAMTHADLVGAARRYLRKTRHTVIACELMTAAHSIPDAIGWKYGNFSTLIECKVSRADFLRDFKKFHRRPEYVCGNHRYYLTPSNLLRPGDLPVGWGLIETDGKRESVIVDATHFDSPCRNDELRILCSMIRRSNNYGRKRA